MYDMATNQATPVGSVGCARSLGLGGEANGVAADEKMRRETISGSQKRDNLSHLDRVAHLVPPIRLQRLGNCADGRFIVRKQVRHVPVRTNAPVRAHPARFERAHYMQESCFCG
jgi:hypothetical protein